MLARFGEVCRPLGRIEGLDFGADRSAYSCRYFVRRLPEERARVERAALGGAFGRRVDASPSDLAMNPDDVRERILAHRAAMGGAAPDLDLPLDVSSGMLGYAATAVVLAGGAGPAVLVTRGELDGALEAVRDWQGAMTLMELRSVLGRTGIAAYWLKQRGGEVRPVQCTARVARTDAEGWHLERMAIHRNCDPPLERSVSVDARGSVTVTDSRPIAFARFICVD